MTILYTLFYPFVFFSGYALGRIGHIYGGHLKAPHHWIYGLVLVVLGITLRNDFFQAILPFFGAGLFVSDLKDFLKFRFFGKDEDGPKKFWGID